ncbi:hypothetical protein AJ80_00419 [Polytolypa hystricis UAMH7299]|uniref:Ribosomal RNA-processing protein 17 n=1 Tax=Polytolypa hystricis (strain UAMH7299) TaxID=1447883 RepID=A0A2B7Z3P7_POLH7|nr:hypothetical protein AJ80_00419 [Polytolypa hystricis UAMH7299]
MAPPHAKRRKLATHKPGAPVAEIRFDTGSREEFLTGFHKRKLQRVKHAQEIAERKAKEEKREQRRKMREDRQIEFQRAIEENRRIMKELIANSDDGSFGSASDNEDEEWAGIAEPPPIDYEAEYIDEDKYTTVTVEELDPSKEGIRRAIAGDDGSEGGDKEGEKGEEGEGKPEEGANDDASEKGKKRVWTKEKPAQPKKKKKKFRYESKEERKITRHKERRGNKKAATARKVGD